MSKTSQRKTSLFMEGFYEVTRGDKPRGRNKKDPHYSSYKSGIHRGNKYLETQEKIPEAQTELAEELGEEVPANA